MKKQTEHTPEQIAAAVYEEIRTAILSKKRKKDNTAGILGLVKDRLRILETGNMSEEYKSNFLRQLDNKDQAREWLDGFIYAMEAVGIISELKAHFLKDELHKIQFPKRSDKEYEEIAQQELDRRRNESAAAGQDGGKE